MVEADDELEAFLALVDRELPSVYAYVLRRCGDHALAEDLTADAFLQAVRQARRSGTTTVTGGWLRTVAHNRLVDHWRSRAREERRLRLAWSQDPSAVGRVDDLGDLDGGRAIAAMATLPASQQAALSLRYLDDLSVPQVAEALGRSVHATESLLVRARTAFRRAYEDSSDD